MQPTLKEQVEQILANTPDFYTVECHGGSLIAHLNGYFYCAGNSITDDPGEIYRFVEYRGFEFSIDEYRAWNPEDHDDMSYFEDMTDWVDQGCADLNLVDCARMWLAQAENAVCVRKEDITPEMVGKWCCDTPDPIDDDIEIVKRWLGA